MFATAEQAPPRREEHDDEAMAAAPPAAGGAHDHDGAEDHPTDFHAANADANADATGPLVNGAVLEAAFVDPAYTWPPPEGEGTNAIELRASRALLQRDKEQTDEVAKAERQQASQAAAARKGILRNGGVGGGGAGTDRDDLDASNTTTFVKTKHRNNNKSKRGRSRTTTTTNTTTETETTRGFWCCQSTDAALDTYSKSETASGRTGRTHGSAGSTTSAANRSKSKTRKGSKPPAKIVKALDDDDDDDDHDDEKETDLQENGGGNDNDHHDDKKKNHADETARRKEAAAKKLRDRERRKQERYSRLPEGILIYKLDTGAHTISLVSEPHNNTRIEKLLTSMVVASAKPSNDPSRRAIDLTGIDGTTTTLVACEQRTAIAWLEAMDIMLGHSSRCRTAAATGDKVLAKQHSEGWGKEKEHTLDKVEEEYLNLAAYSNKLIRAGALPDQKSKGGAGGIYYSMQYQSEQGDDYEEEAIEAIAKRRAVIKDSWDFYRMICSLLRDKRKYDEVFRKLQLDPVYPYLNSMTGLNDPGDDGYENTDKQVVQKDLDVYADMTKDQIATDLIRRAEHALPSLVEICKALAGSLGMEEVGVGPIKEVPAAIRKAEKKYEGDLLKVTDFCRALLVAKDFPTLLALLELARDSFGPLIRRVKLSTLKSSRQSLSGGYRDCKINVELKDHICEIQIHLWPMWTVCGVDGFRHYRHCLEYSTDSFGDPYDALEGLNRKTMAELIVMAEEAVADVPLDNLDWYHEKFILDYFAETGLFIRHGLDVWAEVTLRQLIRLRREAPELGPDHHETLILEGYLERVLRQQGKVDEADQLDSKLREAEKRRTDEKEDAATDLWQSFLNAPTDAYDMIMDPNKKEREEEEKIRKEVKASKKQWRKIRHERFSFLDSASGGGGGSASVSGGTSKSPSGGEDGK